MASGRPLRVTVASIFSGVLALRIKGVSVMPGTMQLTVTPSAKTSNDTDLVKAIRPSLEAA